MWSGSIFPSSCRISWSARPRFQFDRRLELRRTLDEVRIRPIDRIAEHHVFASCGRRGGRSGNRRPEVSLNATDQTVQRKAVVDLRVPGKGVSGIMMPPSWCMNAAAQAAAAMWTRLISKDSLWRRGSGHASFPSHGNSRMCVRVAAEIGGQPAEEVRQRDREAFPG